LHYTHENTSSNQAQSDLLSCIHVSSFTTDVAGAIPIILSPHPRYHHPPHLAGHVSKLITGEVYLGKSTTL
jgi:hypothetical protein